MENPNFYLENVIRDKDELKSFEGPLSLILMLLSKNKIEIKDIRIAEILDQYLEYLDRMHEMNLEVASEFVQMASHLLYIKTKMLLTGEKEPVSELEELIASLEQLKAKDLYSAVRENVPQLKERAETGIMYFTKSQEPLPKVRGEYEYKHEPVELVKALANMFARTSRLADVTTLQSAVPQKFTYSVKDKSRQIISRLSTGPVSLTELILSCESKTEIIAMFLSVLEMCSMGSVAVDIADNGYVLSFKGGDTEEILERIADE